MEFNPIIEFNPKADHQQLDTIEGLLVNANISFEYSEHISRSLNNLLYEDAERIISELSEKQINRITGGLNYNMTYLNKFLKETI